MEKLIYPSQKSVNNAKKETVNIAEKALDTLKDWLDPKEQFMKKVTIYEVARESNVSLATVSRVINGSTAVKEDTKQRVEEEINRLGYRPNAIAREQF